MNDYGFHENIYHICDVDGCDNKSTFQVYPAGQPAGHFHGSTMMCKKHFKIFKKSYSESVDAFYKAAMEGKISNKVKIITH